jgi:hypothetical protein
MHAPHIAPIVVSMSCSLFAIAMSMSSLWLILAQRARGRRAIEARLAALDETPGEISHGPFYGSWWGTAGLTAGAVIYRVVARSDAGEDRLHEWAYDRHGLKTFAHGIWIPVA